MSPEPIRQKIPLNLLIIFFVLSAGIMVSGYLYYAQQKEQLKKEAGKNISSIAELKINGIVQWKKERRGDASALTENPLIVAEVRKISEGKNRDGSRQTILSIMRSLKKNYGYKDIYLLDRKGVTVVSTSDRNWKTGKYAMELASESMKTGKIIFSTLYMNKGSKTIHIDMIAPVLTTRGKASQVYGCFLFHIDPSEFLFPLIQDWLVPSETAETLLIRKEGNDVLFLNELRHRKETALNLRIPLNRKELPAAMAIKGVEGVVEGKDYRNIPVLAAIRAVPETSWFIVSKIDTKEVFGLLKKQAAFIAAIVAVLVLASGLGVLLIWRNQSAEAYKKQYETEHERQMYAQRYEYLTRYANDIILLAERDGQIIDANERAFEVYGYDHKRLLTLNLRDLRSPATKMMLNGQLKEIEALNGLMFETEHQKADGTVFPVEVSSRIISIGNRKYYQSIIRDITERKQAENALYESEEQLRAMFDVASIGIAQADIRTGQWLRVNQKMCKITGYSADEMIRMRVPGITHPEDRQRDWEAFQRVVHGEVPDDRIEKRYIRKDGSMVWVNVNMTVIRDADGQPVHTMATIEDITERKRMEEKVNRLNAELEQRVRDRTAQLEAANKELEAFAYSVSHDLRAPLRAIDGFSRFVLEDYREKLDDEGRRLLNVIRKNTQKMDELITDILALSRVSRTEMSLSRIDMTALVNSIYQELASPEIQEKFIFSAAPLPDAFGDPVLIRQVWINLISNAIKYTMPREERRIEIGGRAESDMNIYFIKDTGVGFNPDYMHKLFGLFQRLHKTEEFEGSGVGLAIVQRVISRHGGKVWAEGEINGGATFSFTMPRQQTKDNRPKTEDQDEKL